MIRKLMIMLVMGLAVLGVACEPDTPSEKLADNIEEAGEEMSDAVEDVGNEVEDACEEVKQESGAADTDC